MSSAGDRIADLLAALTVEQRALLASRLQTVAEPIAVTGMACRYPGGADTPERFWELLHAGTDGVREIPADRFDVDAVYDPEPGTRAKSVTRWAGLIDEVDAFDCGFFGIAPREAAAIDPQHRILLEVAWEGFEDAGQSIERLRGSRTGVFFGIYGSEFSMLNSRGEDVDIHAAGGAQHSVGVSRISYLLDLRGPNVAVDTACSSSLVAIHLACQSLRQRECDLALAGGVNAILSAAPMIALSQARAMARDGRCKTFDDRADGFVRGEGAGVVVLRRLADAVRAGDRILAVVRGSAVNQDGRTNFLSAPNGLAQQAVIRAALESAGLEASRIGYVEAHGTGTALGDPIELESLAAVFGSQPRATPCAIGSVKTNIGHLEAAAGVAGFMKAVLALSRQTIPPHLHFRSLNHLVELDTDRFVIPCAPLAWPANGHPRAAGVSSFSFGGTNAHAVLEESAPQLPRAEQAGDGDAPVVLCLSARGDAALRAIAARHRGALAPGGSLAGVPIADVAFTAAVRRTHHADRLAIVGRSASDLAERLGVYVRGETAERGVFAGHVDHAQRRELAFVFGGSWHQPAATMRALYEAELVFRTAFDETARALDRYLARPLRDVLFDADAETLLTQAAWAEPMLFAGQIALAELWRSWGVTPEAVVGQGPGEIAAAHVAGVLILADAARLVTIRGVVTERRSEENVTRLAWLVPRAEQIPMYSTVAGGAVGGTHLGPSYWAEHITAPVRFADAIAAMAADGTDAFLEIGRAALAASVKEAAERHGGHVTVVSSSSGNVVDGHALRDALAALHTAGVPVDWSRLYAGRRVVSLPAYAWQRQRFPVQSHLAPPPAPAPPGLTPRRVAIAGNPDLLFERELDVDALPFLRDHTILGAVIVPATAYFELIRQALRGRLGTDALTLRRVELREACIVSTGRPRVLQLAVRAGENGDFTFQIWSRPAESTATDPVWVLHAQGGVGVTPPASEPPAESVATIQARCGAPVAGETLYRQALARHGELGPRFRGIAQFWRGDGEALGEIVRPEALRDEPRDYLLHPALLDTAVQLAVFTLASEQTTSAYLPVGMDEVRFSGATGDRLWGRVEALNAAADAEAMGGHVHLWNGAGQTVVRITGLTFRRTSHEAIARVLERRSGDLLYELRWRDAPAPAANGAASGAWLVFADRGGAGDAMAQRLRADGARAVCVVAGSDFAALGPDRFQIDPTDPTHIRSLLAEVPAPQHVAHLWAADRPVDADGRASGPADAECASVLHLVQALLQRKASPRLWLVTRGAQAAGDRGAEVPQSAMVWGVGRTLALEHPELWGGLVDLEPEPQSDEIDRLIAEMIGSKPGDQIALRGSRRLVARLTRSTARATHAPAALRADATYLIAGGTGALGLALARWMASRGARHLVILSRRRPDTAASAALDEIARGGVRVDHHALDIAKRDAVTALFDELARTAPPIRGIVQAAGVLADAFVRDLSWEDFRIPLAAKVAGTWNLHHASEGLPLDFFVMCSSVASLIGSVGQASYAAGNAFLDALATFRRQRHLPALSVNWGPWAGSGMAARTDERTRERFALSGIELMPPETAVGLLDGFVSAGVTGTIAAASVDWTRLRSRLAMARLSLLDDMPGTSDSPTTSAASAEWQALVERLRTATESRRRAMLLDYLRGQVAGVMGLDPQAIDTRAGFIDLGLDSMMALDLKDRLEADLGQPLPATLVFDYANLEALTGYVADSVVQLPPSAAASTAPIDRGPSDPSPDGDDIDNLSETEMVDLLARELDDRPALTS